MSKINLYIDFDDVLVDSNLAIRKLYAKTFNVDIPKELTTWDGEDILTLCEPDWVKNSFDSLELWEYIDFFKGSKESLKILKETELFHIGLCSMGTVQNLKNKMDFLEEHNMQSYFDDYIFLTTVSNSSRRGKNFLIDGIAIDDHIKNLQTVKRPILFTIGQPKRWNDGWKGSSINGWNTESLNIIMKTALEEINSK